jgi:UPF0755 protein
MMVGRRSRRRTRRLVRTLVLATVLLMLITGGVVVANYDWLRSQYLRYLTLDYEGPGVGEVVVRINEGEDGLAVSEKLVHAGVVKDLDSFYRYLLERNPTLYPGSYKMRLEMSNEAAYEIITNPNNSITYKITIPEGFRAVQIFDEISRISGIPVRQIKKVAEDLDAFDLPQEAPTIEGYLFPATYSFDPSATAKDILGAMVDRMNKELLRYGVPAQDTHKVLTLASIIQREAKLESDFYKVSTVFHNRLKIDMRLETDPTISYSYDGKDMSLVSDQESIAYGYNTYLVKGLPPGPISSPGSLAIDAALNPAVGDWIFFVTIDLRSGETKFTKTLREHERWVAVLRQWERDNPGWYDQ